MSSPLDPYPDMLIHLYVLHRDAMDEVALRSFWFGAPALTVTGRQALRRIPEPTTILRRILEDHEPLTPPVDVDRAVAPMRLDYINVRRWYER